jgi:VWFA-related protein
MTKQNAQRAEALRLLGPVVLAVVAAAGLTAQQGGPLAQFSSQVQLVEVYCHVTDARGEPVTGLRREDFEVYENNQLQDVAAFAAGEFPLTVALGVDRSWSMAGDPLRLAKQASQAFLRALTPGDRSMVVAINSAADVIAPLTMDRVNQGRAIAALDPWSTTALHDAMIATLDRLEPESGRQALIMFSDGTDRYSRATAAQVVDRARRSNALIYLIAFGKERPPLLA